MKILPPQSIVSYPKHTSDNSKNDIVFNGNKLAIGKRQLNCQLKC